VLNVTSSNQVSCRWYHNRTSVPGNFFTISGENDATLTFSNALTYYYMGDYVFTCTDTTSGSNHSVLLLLNANRVMPKEFSESDRPFMDEDTLTHSPNVLTVVGRSKVALGPVRVKYIPNWDLEGLWCRPHYKNCCRLKPCRENSVQCSHELKGWVAKYSFSRYTGYGLFTLERQESSAAGQVDGMYSFQLEYRGEVAESRNFSLVTLDGSVNQSAGSGLIMSASIGAVGAFLFGCVLSSLVILSVCLVMRCANRRKEGDYCPSEGSVVVSDDYQEVLDPEGINVVPKHVNYAAAKVGRSERSVNRDSNLDDDLILTVDEGQRV
jgi:hypothetical protein